MRTPLALLILCLLAVVAGVDAQYHPGSYIATQDWIHVISSAGAVTTMHGIRAGGEICGVTMDAENKRLIYGDWGPRALYAVDPTTGARTTLLTDSNLLASPQDLELDQDGNLVVAAWHASAGWGLYRITGGGFTTIATTLGLRIMGAFTGGVCRDVDNGNWVVQTHDTPSFHRMYSIAPDGSSVTTVHRGIPVDVAGSRFSQDPASGHFLVGGHKNFSMVGYLFRVSKYGTTTTWATVTTDPLAFHAPIADRASAASPRAVSVGLGFRYHTDLTTGTVISINLKTSVARARGATILQSRNIQTVKTAPRTWDIRLSFPTLPNKIYALVAGLSGIRPGVTLPDGRRLLINPDVLTFLTLVDAAMPFFNDGGNKLDAMGRATGKLDLTTLPSLGGSVMHMLVIVESSPGNFAAISDPYVMRLP